MRLLVELDDFRPLLVVWAMLVPSLDFLPATNGYPSRGWDKRAQGISQRAGLGPTGTRTAVIKSRASAPTSCNRSARPLLSCDHHASQVRIGTPHENFSQRATRPSRAWRILGPEPGSQSQARAVRASFLSRGSRGMRRCPQQHERDVIFKPSAIGADEPVQELIEPHLGVSGSQLEWY